MSSSLGGTVRRTVIAGTAAALLLSGCAAPSDPAATDDRVQVVTTTELLADLVRNVGGDRVDVTSIVPAGGDPHSYEPTLRDVRDIVYAEVAFSNYALLEEHRIIKALDANLRPGVPNVALVEESVKYAADLIPLVENLSLDTIWLGLRVAGDGAELGASRTSEVVLSATGMSGPGRLVGYLTGSFGQPDIYFDSDDGFDATDGFRDDSTTLPPDAHTHMSWVFTEPGVYRLDLAAVLDLGDSSRPTDIATGTATFAVGVDPHGVLPGAQVLSAGHADLTVGLDAGRFEIRADREDDAIPHDAAEDVTTGHTGHDHAAGHEPDVYPVDQVVVEVPAKALDVVPADPGFRFLGRAGDEIYLLPQAVLGAHVHGEIDPHLWHDVHNVQAYVELIRDELIAVDPAGAADYVSRTDVYLTELEALDAEVRATIGSIPRERRNLVTTHDAFAYLAKAYDLTVAGFVTPNPALEPSLADRRRLSRTLETLDVPAVFLEPNLISRTSTLTEMAAEKGIQVCPLRGDAFDREVTNYIDLMRVNARTLQECLS